MQYIDGKDSDLSKIMYAIQKINRNRDGVTKPKLKLILTGDENQNGYVSKSGNNANVGLVKHQMFRSKQLTYSHRARITQITGFIGSNLVSHENDPNFDNNEMTNMYSDYGILVGDYVGRLGGIRFVDKSEGGLSGVFNDTEFVSNIKTQIETSLANDEIFTVGIILSEDFDLDSLKGTPLHDLMLENELSFTVTTHLKVQGREFDYVIGQMTVADIQNSKKDWPDAARNREKQAAKKLATTIGRARFYSVIVNETSRNFKSTDIGDIIIRSETRMDASLEGVRNLMIDMISSESVPFNAEEAASTKELIERNKAKAAEEAERLKQKRAEDLAKSHIIPPDTTEESIEEERYQELMKMLTSPQLASVENLENIEEKRANILSMATALNADKVASINETAEAKLAYINSDDISTVVAALRHIKDNSKPFNKKEIANIASILNYIDVPGISEDESYDILDMFEDERARLARKRQDSPAAPATVEDEVENEEEEEVEKEDAAKKLADTVEDLDVETVETLEDKKDAAIEAADKGIVTGVDLEELNDKIALVSNGQEEHELDVEEDEVTKFLLEQSLGESSAEDIEGESREERNRRLTAESVTEMSKLEDAGFLAAYADNNGYNGKSSFEMDNEMHLPNLMGSNYNPHDNASDYKNDQLRAMGLKKGYGVKDFDYELRAYRDERSGFLKVAFIATNKKTGKQVIVGALNQIRSIMGNGKDGDRVVKMINSKLNDPLYSSIKETITSFNEGIKIEDPARLLSLELLSPGKISRSPRNIRLDTFMKNVPPGVHISKEIFIVTDKESEYKGDAFLLYSFNDASDFNSLQIEELLKNGFAPVLNGVSELKGKKDGIGLIRLQNKPTSLTSLFNMFAEFYSDEALKLSEIVNPGTGQERLVSLLIDIRKAIVSMKGMEKLGMPDKLSRFINNEDYKGQLGKQEPVIAILDKFRSVNPNGFDALVEVIANVTNENNLGNVKVNEDGEILFNKNGRKAAYVNDRENVATLLDKADTGAEESTVYFDLNRFFDLIDNKSKQAGESGVNPTLVTGIIDEILMLSRSFKDGLYMRPNAYKAKYSNRVFAIANKTLGVEQSYFIKVSGIQPPSIRFRSAELIDLLNGQNVKQADTPRDQQPTESKSNTLVESVNTVINNEGISSSTNKTDLDKNVSKAELALDAIEKESATIEDKRDRVKVKMALDKARKQIEKLRSEVKLTSKPKSSEVSKAVEVLKDSMVNKELLAEMDALKRKFIEEGTFMTQPTKLNEQQWLLVRTESFKREFGDWEILDSREVFTILDSETGEPVLFYNMTNDPDSEFTDNPELAAEDGYSAFIKTEKLNKKVQPVELTRSQLENLIDRLTNENEVQKDCK